MRNLVALVVLILIHHSQSRPNQEVMKRCSRCKIEKPLGEFYKNAANQTGTPKGYMPHCKMCHAPEKRNHDLKHRYGITIYEYNDMLAAQGGVCAICENPEIQIDTRNGKLRDLAVDHSHETQKVRGLLCSLCNVGTGYFKDDPERLDAAANYLRSHA